MENWLVRSVEKVWKCQAFTLQQPHLLRQQHQRIVQRFPVYYVWLFSQIRGICNDIWLLIAIVLNIFTQRMFTNWEKPFLKSWMHSISHIEKSKNCSRTWQYLSFCPFVSRKTLTRKLRLQHGSGSMFLYQFLSRQTKPGTHFFCNANPRPLISSFITALEGLATQSKAQIKLNFTEVETGIKIKLCAILEQLNQRRNQAEGVKFCRWLCRGGGGKGFIHTILEDAKESINWLARTVWTLL